MGNNNGLRVIATTLAIMLLAWLLVSLTSGCAKADKVNYNLNQEARQFKVERRIVVYNARTDKVILEIEGFINIENTSHAELMITAQTGPEEYRKNYVYLNGYTLYTVEDITGTHTDPYHYKMYFHEPSSMIPNVEIVE